MGTYQRFYLILRPAQGNAGGHARLEQHDSRAQISLSIHGVEERCRLRVLLLAGLEPQDAVIDLGYFVATGTGCGTFSRSGILLPGRAQLAACHTLALCLDWPQSKLVLAAPLNPTQPAVPWMVQQAVSRYLAVPVQTPEAADKEEPPVPPTPPKEPTEFLAVIPRAPAPQDLSQPACEPLQASADSSPLPWLDALMPLYWPESLRELKLYFDLLTPCAPFPAPGWRFVKAPLPHGGPGPFCYVGVTAQGNWITQAAYALPAQDGLLPAGLEGWELQTAPNRKNYWVLHQSAH